MKKVILYLFAVSVSLFILIQFIPFEQAYENPPVIAEPKWDSRTTKDLFNRACADCHSHKTRWPWYSRIAPMSWIITDHVIEGREHFNVSAWGVQKENEGEDAAEEVGEGEMPIFGYDITHPEARFTHEEKLLLIRGLRATFGEEGDAHEHHEH